MKSVIISLKFLIITFAFLILQKFSIADENVYKPKLYAGFTGAKTLPMMPDEPISAEKAATLISYFEAEYDDKGRLLIFTKYAHGKVYLVQKIIYDGDKIKDVIITDPEGKIIRRKFVPRTSE